MINHLYLPCPIAPDLKGLLGCYCSTSSQEQADRGGTYNKCINNLLGVYLYTYIYIYKTLLDVSNMNSDMSFAGDTPPPRTLQTCF